MDFLSYTIAWIKGEIFEAILFGASGLLIMIGSLAFLKFGNTPNAKAVIVPFALVGLFCVAAAISLWVSNSKRLVAYPEAYGKNKTEFVLSEKKRVEDFQYLYKMTVIVAGIFFALGIGFFLFTGNHIVKATGLALVFFGFTGLFVDYFSKERADIYYKAITTELQKHQANPQV